MRYRWEIRTGDTWYAGTDANVFISLAGDKGSMKEMEINDPQTVTTTGKRETSITVSSRRRTWGI